MSSPSSGAVMPFWRSATPTPGPAADIGYAAVELRGNAAEEGGDAFGIGIARSLDEILLITAGPVIIVPPVIIRRFQMIGFVTMMLVVPHGEYRNTAGRWPKYLLARLGSGTRLIENPVRS